MTGYGACHSNMVLCCCWFRFLQFDVVNQVLFYVQKGCWLDIFVRVSPPPLLWMLIKSIPHGGCSNYTFSDFCIVRDGDVRSRRFSPYSAVLWMYLCLVRFRWCIICINYSSNLFIRYLSSNDFCRGSLQRLSLIKLSSSWFSSCAPGVDFKSGQPVIC